MMKTRKSLRAARAGFTLIELMMAMVIMSLGLFAIVQMGVVTVRGNAYAREWLEAYDIAQAAVEEVRTRTMGWVRFSGGAGNTLADVRPQLAAVVVDNPINSDLAWDALHALPGFQGKTIAADTGQASSRLINLMGLGPDVPEITGSGDLELARAVYRVHFTANRMPLTGGGAGSNDLIRLTVYVTWDNKDHGWQYQGWDAYTNENEFWRRHMVTLTTYLTPDFHWSREVAAP